MEGLQQAVRNFIALPVRSSQPKDTLYQAIVAMVDELCDTIAEYERQGYAAESLASVLANLRAIHGRSPFIQRLQDWPRGYPGDYESIEYLLKGLNQATPGTVEYYCEEYALRSPIARQHRNKLQHQAGLILNALSSQPERHKRILSLACNSSWDLRQIQHLITDVNATFYLNDHDPEALQFVARQLSPMASRCKLIPGNYIQAIRQLKPEAPFDLITTGGLCDYLNDRQMIFLIKNTVQELLSPGGSLYLTNVAKGNPYRPWMEYMGSWKLLERSRDDLLELCRAAGCPAGLVDFTVEESGLTLLVEIKKN